MQLRDYQKEAYDLLLSEWLEHKEVVLCCPTSWGKSHIVAEVAKLEQNVVILVNITKLVYQLSDLLDELGIAHNIVKANLKKEPKVHGARVTIAMQQTLASRKDVCPPCDVLVVDERHLSFGSPTMVEIEERLKPDKIVGLSATPYDALGAKLKDTRIVDTISIQELTRRKFLTPVITYVGEFSERLDFSDVDVGANGDYSEPQLSKIINTDAYNLEVWKQWKKIAGNKKTIVFASGVDHADALCAIFKGQGERVGVVHSKQKDKENDEIMEQFRTNELQVLVSMSMLNVGFSMSDIECGVMCRPTKTRRLYTQSVGRIMRLHEGKEVALWLDFAQCTSEFGLYDEHYEPPEHGDKDGLEKKKREARLNNISLYLKETEQEIGEVTRHDVELVVEQVRQRVYNNSKTNQKNKIMDLINLFTSSWDIVELVNFGAMIYDLKHGTFTTQKTKDFVLDEWLLFLRYSERSEKMNIKAFKTRTQTIVREGKKFASLKYFADFLREQEQGKDLEW